ncbi:hypothetical protein HanRHA438_Chr08g0367431 [Helianthus annuus]|nr:hypothetical protein HanRHA438_Chr08g0367431 [Helianthus annuus]
MRCGGVWIESIARHVAGVALSVHTQKVGCGRGVVRLALCKGLAKRSSTSSHTLSVTSPQASASRQAILPCQASNADQNVNPGLGSRH